MEPGPVVIGLNSRTAPIEVRERFWMDGADRAKTLRRLAAADGIDEAVVLSTCHRTEFWVWASDPSVAANSVLSFLTDAYQLRLCEWRNFYRLVEEAAVRHVLELTCGREAEAIGELEISALVQAAGEEAARLETGGRFLSALILEALAFAKSLDCQKVGKTVASVSNVSVFDLDDLCRLARRKHGESAALRHEIDEVIAGRARELYGDIVKHNDLQPTFPQRTRLDEICIRELQAFRKQSGPFTREQEKLLALFASRIAKRAAAMIALDVQPGSLVPAGPGLAPTLVSALRTENKPAAYLKQKDLQRRLQ